MVNRNIFVYGDVKNLRFSRHHKGIFSVKGWHPYKKGDFARHHKGFFSVKGWHPYKKGDFARHRKRFFIMIGKRVDTFYVQQVHIYPTITAQYLKFLPQIF